MKSEGFDSELELHIISEAVQNMICPCLYLR